MDTGECQINRKRKSESPDAAVRNQANARERVRTHSVNSAFSMVRMLIPTEPPDRKLSKIETLRLATSYIVHLQSQLSAAEGDEQPCTRYQAGTWQETRLPVCTFCLALRKKVFSSPPPLTRQVFSNSPASYYGGSCYWGKDALQASQAYPPPPLCDFNHRISPASYFKEEPRRSFHLDMLLDRQDVLNLSTSLSGSR